MIKIANPITKKGLKIACEALKGRSDNAGNPCILHSVHLAGHMDYTNAVCVALLHDIVGNSDVALTMNFDGSFSKHQSLFSLFLDSMTDYRPMVETEVNEEIAIRRDL